MLYDYCSPIELELGSDFQNSSTASHHLLQATLDKFITPSLHVVICKMGIYLPPKIIVKDIWHVCNK